MWVIVVFTFTPWLHHRLHRSQPRGCGYGAGALPGEPENHSNLPAAACIYYIFKFPAHFPVIPGPSNLKALSMAEVVSVGGRSHHTGTGIVRQLFETPGNANPSKKWAIAIHRPIWAVRSLFDHAAASAFTILPPLLLRAGASKASTSASGSFKAPGRIRRIIGGRRTIGVAGGFCQRMIQR